MGAPCQCLLFYLSTLPNLPFGPNLKQSAYRPMAAANAWMSRVILVCSDTQDSEPSRSLFRRCGRSADTGRGAA